MSSTWSLRNVFFNCYEIRFKMICTSNFTEMHFKKWCSNVGHDLKMIHMSVLIRSWSAGKTIDRCK